MVISRTISRAGGSISLLLSVILPSFGLSHTDITVLHKIGECEAVRSLLNTKVTLAVRDEIIVQKQAGSAAAPSARLTPTSCASWRSWAASLTASVSHPQGLCQGAPQSDAGGRVDPGHHQAGGERGGGR